MFSLLVRSCFFLLGHLSCYSHEVPGVKSAIPKKSCGWVWSLSSVEFTFLGLTLEPGSLLLARFGSARLGGLANF